MKYNESNEFVKKIVGELIDISFPYPNNAYMTNREIYRSKLMDSHTFKGLYEFNGFGLLNDLVEMIELESIDTNKPYKLEKRMDNYKDLGIDTENKIGITELKYKKSVSVILPLKSYVCVIFLKLFSKL